MKRSVGVPPAWIILDDGLWMLDEQIPTDNPKFNIQHQKFIFPFGGGRLGALRFVGVAFGSGYGYTTPGAIHGCRKASGLPSPLFEV